MCGTVFFTLFSLPTGSAGGAGSPACQVRVRVLSSNAGGRPCLPCEQLLARGLPSELCPQRSWVPVLRGEGGKQRHRDTTASGLSLFHFRTPSCDSLCAVTPACVPGACHPCRSPGAGLASPPTGLGGWTVVPKRHSEPPVVLCPQGFICLFLKH